jgi:Fic family protein
MDGMLPYTDTGASRLCDELDTWRARLDYRGALPRRWAGRLRRELEAEAVAASTRMEGVAVTVDEVRRILAGEEPPEVSHENRELVEGYRQAMVYVLRRADDPAFTWNRELIVGLHDRILAGRYDLGAGRFRTGPAYVVDRRSGTEVFRPPSEDSVPGLVDEACRNLNDATAHPAMASAWIHVAIAAIHPFKDGNGRAARVLASLAMYRGGFTRPEFTSLEEWWGNHLGDYYEAFACLGPEFTLEADISPFIEAHLDAQLRQVRALDLRERVQREIWIVAEEIAEGSRLNARLANAFWDAFFGRTITAGYYRSLADVSPATASNDLGAAAAAGFLSPRGERRGRHYLAGDRLFEAIAATIGVSDGTGPPEVARDRIIASVSERLTRSGEASDPPAHD